MRHAPIATKMVRMSGNSSGTIDIAIVKPASAPRSHSPRPTP